MSPYLGGVGGSEGPRASERKFFSGTFGAREETPAAEGPRLFFCLGSSFFSGTSNRALFVITYDEKRARWRRRSRTRFGIGLGLGPLGLQMP